jgi:hypothetical protein
VERSSSGWRGVGVVLIDESVHSYGTWLSYVPARVSFELKVRMVWFSSGDAISDAFFGSRAWIENVT